jgi:hypothetical protein
MSSAADHYGAETSFSKLNPPTLYARRAIVQAQRDIPQEAIEQLRLDPKSAPAFDQHYGTKGLGNISASRRSLIVDR